VNTNRSNSRTGAGSPVISSVAQQRDDAWRFVGSFESSALRAGLSPEDAVEILLVLGSPSTWSSLVTDAGWALERYERWFADAMSRIVFALE
jgi:hypothetical protein